ncbi:MAG TPA: FAD-dependent oxidoreductase [Bryobacteraceae bacterium]|nr:FAD-dependent oxidoreductase [Bryobacteraceae bacterium]
MACTMAAVRARAEHARACRIAALLLMAVGGLAGQTAASYDVVVYGGTAGGVITAVSAARMGLKTALLEPGRHIGGMVASGLSHTDVGRREVIGGYSLEFYWRAGTFYGLPQYLQDIAWYVEPKVASSIFQTMLQEAGVTVLTGRRLREQQGVRMENGRVASLQTENGERYTAKIFADATYEGDLMAASGVTYTWGRESQAQYGESLAGVRGETPKHQFLVDLSPYGADGKLLPEISAVPAAPAGSADRKVQAYNFRMIFSEDPANQVPYPKPEGYDPQRYELMRRLLAREPGLHMGDVLSVGPIPNRKVDINNNGPFSTDYIGGSWDFPEGNYARRAEIFRAHEEYTKGLLWFLAHDPAVPAVLQAEVNRWGLAKDEFTGNGNFPWQLYIREARRMVGEYVMTQRDIQTDLTKPDVIGMGSYNSDSHNVERVVNAAGFVRNEGDMQVPVKPYQIPYRILVPKRGQAANLLVPVCFSASHVAYSTLRMEPQYMIMGQAAGVAAALAIRAGTSVQDVDTRELTRTLVAQGAILEYVPSAQERAIGILWARKK